MSNLLADAQDRGIVGVGKFLDYVADLEDAGAREEKARATTEGAVQIISVHAAKGLEFPVVIISDVTRGSWGSGGLLVDPELGLLLPRVRPGWWSGQVLAHLAGHFLSCCRWEKKKGPGSTGSHD